MKKPFPSSIIFSILMITACSAQQSIEVTGTRFAKVTVTLPSPTETPPPTPTPQSLLPREVKEKFELAGVDLTQMQNAKYDKDGLHITLPSGEVIVLTNDQLQKGMYNGQDNVLQYRDEANQNVIYAFDEETGKWGVKVEQIDISNPEAFRTVEWEYLISPAYLAELEQKEKDGLLPKVPDNPSYVQPGYVSFTPDKTPSVMIKNNGFDLLFTISSSSLYSDMEKRPFQLVDITKTKIEGVDFYFYVIKWENDPSIANESGFLGYITPISDYTHKIGLNKLVGFTQNKYVTGLYISDAEGNVTTNGCKKVLENTVDGGTSIEPFCEYLAKNQETLIQPEIYKLWSEKGTLINNSIIPVSFAAVKNTSN